MAAASGFRRSRMFQATGAAAEAVFVNVADWDSATALRRAFDDPRWRRLTQRMQNDLDLTARPEIYQLTLDVAPGDVLSR